MYSKYSHYFRAIRQDETISKKLSAEFILMVEKIVLTLEVPPHNISFLVDGGLQLECELCGKRISENKFVKIMDKRK